MEVNYVIVLIILLIVLLLLVFIIKKNRRDQKDLEHELNMSEMKPEEHDREESTLL